MNVPVRVETSSQVGNVAEVAGVTHVYGTTVALDDVSLQIPSGKTLGLIGPDGVGKSTLLGLLSGARKMQTGAVTVFDGNMASTKHRNAVCTRIAYMPQGLGKNLYQELSVHENLDFFGKLYGQSRGERKARIERLTTATGLASFLNRPAGKLSGGMKQKLGLCCALIHDPDFLILDEPTTGVDPLSRRQFWELIDSIRAERSGMSVLVSTAYMDEAQRFDRLIAMNAGKVLATGTPDEIKANTKTDNLEQAFVALLPPENQGGKQVLTIPPRTKTDGDAAIVAEGLTQRFGDFTAVDNVSFRIEAGEIFGFLGSNGCGKTTTMKMLTGLLPPTEGKASLWGKEVDAKDLATRYRVGFMSQGFSLYGELTVRQNLQLHARLFHMPAAKTQQRIEKLVGRFGLTQYTNAKANSLPLGLRQRLSLAVAIIHEPEMLILDEPTSGVDPVARDQFWELLIDLSRSQNVTIFISTHFMNEAMRCDRISLMHAGKVLVQDNPQTIANSEGGGVHGLEEAFIRSIEKANGASTSPDVDAVTTIDNPQRAISTQPIDRPLAGLTRLLAYSYRETMEVLRDPVRLTFAFGGSLLLLLVIAYGLSSDVENLSYAVLDQDQTPASRTYLQEYSSSRYFTEQPELLNEDDLEARLATRKITMAIEIPPSFGRDLKRDGNPEVSVWIDGAETSRASTIEGYVEGAHRKSIQRFARESTSPQVQSELASFELRYRYNPTFESIYAMGPTIPTMMLLLFPAILMAVSVSREKEIGTITNFYVTPTRRMEFLLGKQLPYIGIGMANFAILTVVVVYLLQVPMKGSLLTLTFGAFLYVTATTGYGLLVSNLASSQVTAVLLAAILSMMPTMQFSGMFQPVSTLEGAARVMGTLWPAAYYLHLSVGTFTKGLSAVSLIPDLVKLAMFSPVFWLLCVLLLKKQEK
ncbi:ribosome-associated ATPase/putative transporter RbbA [Rubripirellula reticaptiva]|uniref:Putative ABC transporter ATP-binding protein YbhF n=1 Tax=Rubripirellula reticaptiva TaxID=2528013 RepID=A0A5C6EFP7_9BACT|nr:ribosome-associated ATPase/putative transporter RbbA [Rubripirellula reticaptiva]TWU46877.1 putative ABC transporter ATP-binding protein YbhF [Rubripirellula reticaptiva]